MFEASALHVCGHRMRWQFVHNSTPRFFFTVSLFFFPYIYCMGVFVVSPSVSPLFRIVLFCVPLFIFSWWQMPLECSMILHLVIWLHFFLWKFYISLKSCNAQYKCPCLYVSIIFVWVFCFNLYFFFCL